MERHSDKTLGNLSQADIIIFMRIFMKKIISLLIVFLFALAAFGSDEKYDQNIKDALKYYAGSNDFGNTFRIIQWTCAGASFLIGVRGGQEVCIRDAAQYVGEYRDLLKFGRALELYSALILHICTGIPHLTPVDDGTAGSQFDRDNVKDPIAHQNRCLNEGMLGSNVPQIEQIARDCQIQTDVSCMKNNLNKFHEGVLVVH